MRQLSNHENLKVRPGKGHTVYMIEADFGTGPIQVETHIKYEVTPDNVTKLLDDLYRIYKLTTFGILYGMGAQKLHENLQRSSH